ncbi:MAG: DUF6129 family protein [Pseudolabrys sp.]|jgi:hypothetical protein
MITPEQVEGIADGLAGQGLDESAVSALRAAYPDIHFTYCSDDDIVTGSPVTARSGFNVYLVDGREHCLQLTGDYGTATGLVLAYCVDEDED